MKPWSISDYRRYLKEKGKLPAKNPIIPASGSRKAGNYPQNSENSDKIPEVLIIGIDPDVDKSGVCEWNKGKKELRLQTLTFFQLFEYLSLNRLEIDLVKIESGWKNANQKFRPAKNIATAGRMGANVGANLETGKKIVEMCKHLGLPYREVKPFKKFWKGLDGKITHDELQAQLRFRGLPEIIGRTNQEQRDSALICLNG